jgi:hypothetical protein
MITYLGEGVPEIIVATNLKGHQQVEFIKQRNDKLKETGNKYLSNEEIIEILDEMEANQ